LLRTGQGLVAASFSTVALAYIGEALPPRWRSTAIGFMSTAFLSAGILGQVYAQAVAEARSHHWVKYRALARLAVRRELALVNAASFPVLLSFVGMYAALGSGAAEPVQT
jgi:YNFM family putative membrane transporter